MERLLFEDWRELASGEQDTGLFASASCCGGAPLLVSGVCEGDTAAASDLSFLDSLLPQLADGCGGRAGACGAPCGGDDAAPLSYAHGRPHEAGTAPAAAKRARGKHAGPLHACLDGFHPPDCTRCTPPPCAEDAALFFLRGSKGARAVRRRRARISRDASPRPAGCSSGVCAVRGAPTRAAPPAPRPEALARACRRAADGVAAPGAPFPPLFPL
jgi:hypothetical protein